MASNSMRNLNVTSSNGMISNIPATAAIAPPGGGSLIVVPAVSGSSSSSNPLRQYQTTSLSSSQISSATMPSSSSNSNNNGMSTSACIQITQRLMQYRIPSDENEQFIKRAIESLVKKLKDRRDEMDGLCQSIQYMGASHSKCVTIPRTLDGRLQVAGRKGFPHVVYSRIWRWPDVHKNELKHRASICQYGFDLKLELVCVNPYHYERVAPPLHLGDESGMSGNQAALSDEECSITAESNPPSIKYNNLDNSSSTKSVINLANTPKRSLPPQPVFPSHKTISPRVLSSNMSLDRLSAGSNTSRRDISQMLSVPGVIFNRMSMPFMPNGRQLQTSPNHHILHRSPVRQMGPNNGSATSNSSHNCSSGSNYNNVVLPELPDLHKDHDNGLWCTISYFEHCVNVGEPYRVPYSMSQVIVDGFTDPASPGRFCLGQVPNIERTATAEKVRLFIGHGIRLSNGYINNKKHNKSLSSSSQDSLKQSLIETGRSASSQSASAASSSQEESHINASSVPEDAEPDAGAIWLENRSDRAVFVQSAYLDFEYGWSEQNHSDNRVHKIYPKSTIQVYDLNWWRQRLTDWMQRLLQQQSSPQGTKSAFNHSTSSPDIPYDLMEQLTSQCAIQCSFVKGWGLDYNRKSVTDTPCWIEIQFHDALSLLDYMLLHTSSLVSVLKCPKVQPMSLTSEQVSSHNSVKNDPDKNNSSQSSLSHSSNPSLKKRFRLDSPK